MIKYYNPEEQQEQEQQTQQPTTKSSDKKINFQTSITQTPLWRLKPIPTNIPRYNTNLKAFDKEFRGLTYGLTIFIGQEGTGKSKLAKLIASKTKGKCLYVICESIIDAPKSNNVLIANYTRNLPLWQKALQELYALCNHIQPDLVVIDSITEFLSNTTKAVSEADIRPGAFEISKAFEEQKLPVIGISEVRGTGYNEAPAGGKAISHAGHMIFQFTKRLIETPWEEERYETPIGNYAWFITCIKDKQGQANQGKQFRITYTHNEQDIELHTAKQHVNKNTNNEQQEVE